MPVLATLCGSLGWPCDVETTRRRHASQLMASLLAWRATHNQAHASQLMASLLARRATHNQGHASQLMASLLARRATHNQGHASQLMASLLVCLACNAQPSPPREHSHNKLSSHYNIDF